jgi:hypothetical protein
MEKPSVPVSKSDEEKKITHKHWEEDMLEQLRFGLAWKRERFRVEGTRMRRAIDLGEYALALEERKHTWSNNELLLDPESICVGSEPYPTDYLRIEYENVVSRYLTENPKENDFTGLCNYIIESKEQERASYALQSLFRNLGTKENDPKSKLDSKIRIGKYIDEAAAAEYIFRYNSITFLPFEYHFGIWSFARDISFSRDPHLTTLRFFYHEFQSSELYYLGLVTSLTHLSLRKCRGVNHILDNLTHIEKPRSLSNLISLDIFSCEIDNYGAHCISLLSALTKIDLDFNSIGDEGALKLASNPRLVHLSLRRNLRLTDKSYRNIQTNTSLRVLYLTPTNLSIDVSLYSEIEEMTARNQKAFLKRREELQFIMISLILDVRNSASKSIWRRLPGDMRRMIAQQLCYMWADTLALGRSRRNVLERWNQLESIKKFF